MNPHRLLGTTAIGAAALSLLLAACATVPPPTAQFAAARAAIQSAEVEGAGQMAPNELSQAREKLTAAQAAAHDDHAERARRLAEQAVVDAQLAQATASAARSRQALSEADAALRALHEEANRPTQPATPVPVTPPPGEPPLR